MLVQRAYVYRLEPTTEQAAFLAQTAGACRALYNLALEQRSLYWRPGRSITLVTQSRELTALRAQFGWMAAAPRHALQAALVDLDRAFRSFFEGRAEFPRFKRRGDGDGFRLGNCLDFQWARRNRNKGAIRLPKAGWIKLRGYRPLGGEKRWVSISSRGGHWYAAVAWQAEAVDVVPSPHPPVGIDRGVDVFAALSTGESYVAPRFLGRVGRRLDIAQRRLARRIRGSANWRKQKARVARLHIRAADARRDFLHKASTEIAKNHGMVAIEKLQVRKMTRSGRGTVETPGTNIAQKAGLNRAILDRGWGTFATFLRYKLAMRGGDLIEVPPAHTSQTCAACGAVSKDNRQSQAVFACVGCGHTANADTNAAINILRAGRARWACGSNHVSGRKQELSLDAARVASRELSPLVEKTPSGLGACFTR